MTDDKEQLPAQQEDQRRRSHLIKLEERRFLDIELRILQRRLAQVIAIKAIAEVAIGPVADVFDRPGTSGCRTDGSFGSILSVITTGMMRS